MKTHDFAVVFYECGELQNDKRQESSGIVWRHMVFFLMKNSQSIFHAPEMEMTDDGASECERADLLL